MPVGLFFLAKKDRLRDTGEGKAKYLRGGNGNCCCFLVIKAHAFDTTGAGVETSHRTVYRHGDPMKVHADGSLGVICPSFPLPSRHTTMVFVGAAGDRVLTADIAFECHRGYTIPYVG